MKTLAGLIAAVLLSTTPAHAEEWKYDATIYFWLTGLEGEMGIGDAVTAPVGATFSDLLNFVDFAMAGHVEAKNPRVVLVTDLAYFNLGSERDATVLKQPVAIDLDVQEYVFELAGGYRVTPEVDLFLAGRWYLFEFGAATTSEFGSSSADDSHSWGDIYAGARWTRSFEEDWFFSVRGDIGTGGSEFAWFTNIALGYHFNETVSAGVGWRSLSLDREPGDDDFLLYDVTQAGFGLGVGFSF